MNLSRSTRSRRAAVAAVVALGLTGAACGGTDSSSQGQQGTTETPAGPTALRVSYVPATTVLPLHIAKAQGFFTQNNLDVTLTEAANISDIPATLGRQFDLALGTATDLIRAGAAGVDVVQVAGNTNSTKSNPFVKLIVRPDSGITDVTQLRGKTVGTPTLSGVIHAAVKYEAKQKGVDPFTIGGVEAPTPNLPDQLRAGRIDAVEALEPIASQLIRAGNVAISQPFDAIGDPLATNFWLAQGSWANKNRDAVTRFVDALKQGQAFIDQNPTEARRILQEYTKLPEAVASSVPLPTYNFDIRSGDLDAWVKVLKDIGEFNGQVDTRKLVLSSGK
ncbi:MAG TPA: ABC transporter substrate-binding protein [Acidimicrobiales bacterium]|nr:ABC transporter substrate-binding protein [Acidimicrobiales bacterium]